MSTRYWLNTTADGDDTNPANYDLPPQNGDDLAFDSSQSGYNGPSIGDQGNNGLAGMTFGTISLLDGSSIGSAFSCDTLYLQSGSLAGCNCNVLDAGADGSECLYNGNESALATFSGQSQNLGNLGGIVTFNDSAQNNNGIQVDTASFNDDAVNINTIYANRTDFFDAAYNAGSVSGAADFHNNTNNAGTVFGIADFHDASNNQNGNVNGVANFDVSATNQGTVTGAAYFASGTPDATIYGPTSTTPIIPPAANVQSGFAYGANGSQVGTLSTGSRAYTTGGNAGY